MQPCLGSRVKTSLHGNEIGQWSEWDHDTGLNWFLLDYDTHRKLQLL